MLDSYLAPPTSLGIVCVMLSCLTHPILISEWSPKTSSEQIIRRIQSQRSHVTWIMDTRF